MGGKVNHLYDTLSGKVVREMKKYDAGNDDKNTISKDTYNVFAKKYGLKEVTEDINLQVANTRINNATCREAAIRKKGGDDASANDVALEMLSDLGATFSSAAIPKKPIVGVESPDISKYSITSFESIANISNGTTKPASNKTPTEAEKRKAKSATEKAYREQLDKDFEKNNDAATVNAKMVDDVKKGQKTVKSVKAKIKSKGEKIRKVGRHLPKPPGLPEGVGDAALDRLEVAANIGIIQHTIIKNKVAPEVEKGYKKAYSYAEEKISNGWSWGKAAFNTTKRRVKAFFSGFGDEVKNS